MTMETWAIVVLVLGSNIIIALSTFFATKMQVSHSDKQFERAREVDAQQRRREVRGEPLLKLRNELASMATKQEKLVAAAHRQHTRFGITEEEAKKELQEAVDNWNDYVSSGDFPQTLFLQYDEELVNCVEEIRKDYQKSYIDAVHYKELKAKELGESMKVFERMKSKIAEVQSLINKQLEEL